MKLKPYVVSTARGYAYGLRDDYGRRYLERYAHVEPGLSDWGGKIDRAYKIASDGAASLASTLAKRPELLTLKPMPGNVFVA